MKKSSIINKLTELSKVRNLETAKAWWHDLSVTEKAQVVAILTAVITAPIAAVWASKLATTHLVADAGVLYAFEVSAPFWFKFMMAVGITSATTYVAYKTTEHHYNSMVESLGEI